LTCPTRPDLHERVCGGEGEKVLRNCERKKKKTDEKEGEKERQFTEEDDPDIRSTLATFGLVDLDLSINFVIDSLRLAFVCHSLLALCGSFVGKVLQWGPLRVDVLEVDRGCAMEEGCWSRRFLLSLLALWWILGGSVVESHG
jgi:hypothetical protein